MIVKLIEPNNNIDCNSRRITKVVIAIAKIQAIRTE